MKRPDEVTEYLRCGGANCDGACNTQLDKLGVEDCLTWRVHGYVQKLEERIVHLEALDHQNLSVITMQERTRARLEEQISQIESNVPRWISVEERLPETCAETRSFYHSVTVLASENGRIMMGYFTASKDDGSYDFTGVDSHKKFYDFAKPSHWMPLPEPPKEE